MGNERHEDEKTMLGFLDNEKMDETPKTALPLVVTNTTTNH